jgi:hypothetical protein
MQAVRMDATADDAEIVAALPWYHCHLTLNLSITLSHTRVHTDARQALRNVLQLQLSTEEMACLSECCRGSDVPLGLLDCAGFMRILTRLQHVGGARLVQWWQQQQQYGDSNHYDSSSSCRDSTDVVQLLCSASVSTQQLHKYLHAVTPRKQHVQI